VKVDAARSHAAAGGLRTSPLPTAEIAGDGTVYVAWQDCRFRSGCSANDIVVSTTTQSSYPTWSSVSRIPIDATTSGADHFIPGLAVDPATAGSSAHLALTYYYYPSAACGSSPCQLDVGYISSSNGGFSWRASAQLAGPMLLGWLPRTSLGRMVGDYISTSFSGGTAHPAFAVARQPAGTFDQAMYSPTSGLP
jgi:hypothetical protein